MALIKCPECGKEISDKAKQCPKCGWKIDLDAIKNTELFQEEIVKDVAFKEIILEENTKDAQISVQNEDAYVPIARIKEEPTPKKKGKYLKPILIAGVVLIVLGIWSVILVNITVYLVVAKLDNSQLINNMETGVADVLTMDESSIQVDEHREAEVIDETVENNVDIENIYIDEQPQENVNSDIEVSYSHFRFCSIYILVKNNTNEPVNISFGSTYFNDINIKRLNVTGENPILPGKTNQVEIYYGNPEVFTPINNTINKFEVEIYLNDEEKTGEPLTFTLDNLGVNIKD